MSVGELIDEISINEREGTRIADPFSSFGDIARVSIVTRRKDESEPICELIEDELDVDDGLTLTFTGAEASNDDMQAGGYPGRIYYDFPRLVVSLSAERSALAEWQAFSGLKAEICVQTLLQRAWQEVDERALAYTWDSSYAARARAALVRLATLVAEADEELTSINHETREAEQEAVAAIADAELSLPIDAATLWAYLVESPTVTHLLEVGESAGLRPFERVADSWELEHRLLWLLRRSGFATIGDLEDLLVGAEHRAGSILGSIADLGTESDFVPSSSPASVVAYLVLVLTRADSDTVALTEFRHSIQTAINTLIGNPVER